MVPEAIALSQRYGELDLPIVVMTGQGDLIARVDEHAEPFARQVNRADLRIVVGEGTCSTMLCPAKSLLQSAMCSVRAHRGPYCTMSP
jgi:hypothetical protein